jgi:hypothetical protein
MARWARPGGLVVVEVPNWHSFHRRNAGSAWSNLRPLEHVSHYSPATLRSTIRRSGLSPLDIVTPGFLSRMQTLDQQLDDLGLYRLEGRVRFLGKAGEYDGGPATLPRRITQVALLGLQATYQRFGVGQVIMGIARVP